MEFRSQVRAIHQARGLLKEIDVRRASCSDVDSLRILVGKEKRAAALLTEAADGLGTGIEGNAAADLSADQRSLLKMWETVNRIGRDTAATALVDGEVLRSATEQFKKVHPLMFAAEALEFDGDLRGAAGFRFMIANRFEGAARTVNTEPKLIADAERDFLQRASAAQESMADADLRSAAVRDRIRDILRKVS